MLDLWQTLSCLADNSACCDGVYRTPAHVLALMPTSVGKTKPAMEMIAMLSNPLFAGGNMHDKPEIDLFDDEYMTPAQREALRKTLETPPPPPPPPPASDPVAIHRALNGTTGQESEA